MKQKWNVVILNGQVALVNLRGERQAVQVLCLQFLSRRVVDDLSVLAVTRAENFAERLTLRKLHHGVIKFAAHNKVDVITGHQTLIGLHLHRRSHKGNPETGLHLFHPASKLDVVLKTDSGREKNYKFVVLCDFDGLLRSDFVRRSIQQAAAGQHSRGIGEPHGVPVRLNLARSGPPRTCATIKLLETRRIQQQRLQNRHHTDSLLKRPDTTWLFISHHPLYSIVPESYNSL